MAGSRQLDGRPGDCRAGLAAKTRTAEDSLTPTVKDPKRHEQFLARIKQGPVGLLLLGDSITDFWPGRGKESWEKLAPYHPADFGISADRTEHVLWRITNGELDGIAPKVVMIMIGTNNIGHFQEEQPEWAAAGVKKIVETVHAKLPETKVLLLSVFPRDRKNSSARQKVEAINEIISKLDDGNKTRYLDVSKCFLDADGEIPKDIMPDGLHPNAHGYDLWYEADAAAAGQDDEGVRKPPDWDCRDWSIFRQEDVFCERSVGRKHGPVPFRVVARKQRSKGGGDGRTRRTLRPAIVRRRCRRLARRSVPPFDRGGDGCRDLFVRGRHGRLEAPG